jgi:hypothetical protein
MIFVDFTFRLFEDGSIEMDPELALEQINAKEGDLFKIEIVNDRIIFKKQPPRQIWEGD